MRVGLDVEGAEVPARTKVIKPEDNVFLESFPITEMLCLRIRSLTYGSNVRRTESCLQLYRFPSKEKGQLTKMWNNVQVGEAQRLQVLLDLLPHIRRLSGVGRVKPIALIAKETSFGGNA